MLIGNYSSKITGSNRVAIPKKFRTELGKTFIVAKWYENCLVAISKKNWEELMGKLTGSSKIITEPVRDTDRFILGSAFELTSDSQGRVVLSDSLISYAKLKQNVVFLGLGDRVEIWDRKVWRHREEYLSRNASQLVEELAKHERT